MDRVLRGGHRGRRSTGHGLPGDASRPSAAAVRSTSGAEPVRDFRDHVEADGPLAHLAWLYQLNGGVFLPAGDPWTISLAHTDEDLARSVDAFEGFAAAVDRREPRTRRSRSLGRAHARGASSEGDPDGTLLVFHHGSPGAAVPFPSRSTGPPPSAGSGW